MITRFTNRDLFPIVEAYRMVCENAEGRNINKAEKFVKQNHPEIVGTRLQNGTTMTPRVFTQEIRNLMPNVRLAECKFLLGASRIYFDDMSSDTRNFQRNADSLNKILKLVADPAHVNEYDNNLNGLGLKQLEERFSSAVKKNLEDDMKSVGSSQYVKNDTYDIVRIDDYEEASKYSQYTSWCVTHYGNMFDNYTKDGLGVFYFCLRKGFESVPRERGEGCPMDEYGKSMIAISVNDDGSLNTCTCRWNHDYGGNDSMMTTKEISDFFGVNFYETFRPRDARTLFEQFREKSVEDSFASRMGWLCVPSDDSYGEYDYVRLTATSKTNPQPRLVKYRKVFSGYSSSGSVVGVASGEFYWYTASGHPIEPPMRVVGGIHCPEWPQLVSLRGCPRELEGVLDCSGCANLLDISAFPDRCNGADFSGCESLNDNSFATLAKKPAAVASFLFPKNKTFKAESGFYTAEVPIDDLGEVYDGGRDGISWDFVKGVLEGEDTYDLFESGDMPSFGSLDECDFDAVLSDYGVTWSDMGKIYDYDYDEVDDQEVLTERKCEDIGELLHDDFYDGMGIAIIWGDCSRNGMEEEAYDDIMSQISEELPIDREYGCRNGKLLAKIGPTEAAECLHRLFKGDYGQTSNVLVLARSDDDGDVERVSVVQPYYGYDGFDEKEWQEAVHSFAEKVLAIVERNDPPEDAPGQMTFDFGG